MTTTFLMARHGAHDEIGRTLSGRSAGLGLSREGRRQAECLAGRLRRERIDALYASPTRRVRETAEIIAARCGRHLSIEPALEEIDFGLWTGRRIADLDADPAWHIWNERRSEAGAPGGETMRAVQDRVVAWMETCRSRHEGGSVVMVGHCDPIRAALLHHLGLSLDAIERIEVAPGSLTGLAVGDWGARLLFLNEVPRR